MRKPTLNRQAPGLLRDLLALDLRDGRSAARLYRTVVGHVAERRLEVRGRWVSDNHGGRRQTDRHEFETLQAIDGEQVAGWSKTAGDYYWCSAESVQPPEELTTIADQLTRQRSGSGTAKRALGGEVRALRGLANQPRPAFRLVHLSRWPQFDRGELIVRRANEIWRNVDEFRAGFGPELAELRAVVAAWRDGLDLNAPLVVDGQLLSASASDRIHGWLRQSYPAFVARDKRRPVIVHMNVLSAAYFALAEAVSLEVGSTDARWIDCPECGRSVPRSNNRQIYCSEACEARARRKRLKEAKRK